MNGIIQGIAPIRNVDAEENSWFSSLSEKLEPYVVPKPFSFFPVLKNLIWNIIIAINETGITDRTEIFIYL